MAFVLHPLIKENSIQSRIYQEVLVASVLEKGNSLVVAPTALGKTIVASMVSAFLLEKNPEKKVLILAPTKPLAVQHYNSFKKFINLPEEKICLMTGSVPPAKRIPLWNESRIISATPQSIENDLLQGKISFKDVVLIVFDEAHKSVGDYSYVFLAQNYVKQNPSGLILGLTASPGGEKERIDDVCNNLFIKNIEIKSEKDADVKPYVNEIKVDWIKVDLPPSFLEIKLLLRDFMKEQLVFLKQFGFAKSISVQYVRRTDLLEMQSKIRRAIASNPDRNPALYSAISKLAALLKVSHAELLLETQGINSLNDYFCRLKKDEDKTKAAKFLLSHESISKAIKKTSELNEKNIEHPKVLQLINVLKKQFSDNSESKVLVFSHYRGSASFLENQLNAFPEIKAKKFIGQASKENDKGMNQKQQIQTIQDLKQGKYNVLIATSLHPEEFVVLKDSSGRVKIEEVGNFVDSFSTGQKANFSKKITGWKVLSFDGNKNCFMNVTSVIKHKCNDNVVNVKLASGFEAKITKDHSLFSFDEKGELVETEAELNKFVKISLNLPSEKIIEEIDLVREAERSIPEEEFKRFFCSVEGLSQAKIRELKSDNALLKVLNRKGISNETSLRKSIGVDYSTIRASVKRLKQNGFITTNQRGRILDCSITVKGRDYFISLNWILKNYFYWKKKYRIKAENLKHKPAHLNKYFKIYLEELYCKTKLPEKIKITEALADLFGLYVSEGNARKGKSGGRIYLASINKKMRKRMIESIKNSNLKPAERKRGIAIDSQLAYYLITHVFDCGIGAYNKKVPDILFSCNNNIKWAFLKGYLDGDGYYTKDKIVATTVSRKLVAGLILLLRQLGIKKISLYKQKHILRLAIWESLPFFKFKQSKGNKAYYHTVPKALLSKKDYLKFGNNFSLGARMKNSITEETCFDYIKKIETLEKQPEFVYDLSVEKTEKFIGGTGLICFHNSVAEEGLDIPEVDLVVFFEPVPSEIRTIQRRGRTGRLAKGKTIILMAKGTRDEAFYWSSIAKENKMKKTLTSLKTMQLKNSNPVLNKNKMDSQTTLSSFSENDFILIFVDSREQASTAVRELSKFDNVSVKVKQLELGDYVLSDEVVIERKTVEDFLASMLDGRLFSQLIALSTNCKKPLMIVEGNKKELFTLRNIHENAIKGALSSILLDYQVPILFTDSVQETVSYLYLIAKREQLGKAKEIRLRVGRKGLSLPELQQFVVESFPSVGPTLAKNLLRKFKSIKKLVNADEKKLMKTDKIGQKKAREIRKLIEAEYKEDN